MALQEEKPVYLSKTVGGAIVTIGTAVTGIIVAKTHLPPEYVAPAVNLLLVQVVSGAVSLFGRLYAKAKLTVTK